MNSDAFYYYAAYYLQVRRLEASGQASGPRRPLPNAAGDESGEEEDGRAAPLQGREERNAAASRGPAAVRRVRTHTQSMRGPHTSSAAPSQLLKMLRPPPSPRPLFLAAPGVANAQVGHAEARVCVCVCARTCVHA